jgi:tetratricopeptide (TPR) repeat protein
MRHRSLGLARAAAFGLLLLLCARVHAQYREYYVHGRVVDTQKAPLANVRVDLVDPDTSRAFHMKTDKKGEFKLAGLPHARYQVSFSLDTYATAHDEWAFDAPQDRMQRVDVPDVVLVSEARVREVERLAGAKAGVEKAEERIREGDLDAAISVLQGVLEKSPDDPNALYYLGLSYAGKKMYGEAMGRLTRVTELAPTFPAAWFELGVCQGALGEVDEALAAYDKNLELEPGNASSAYNSGLIFFEQNRIEEAQARFETGLVAKPDDPDLNEMAGRCFLHQGKIEKGLDRLEKARRATTDPDKQQFLDSLIEQARALTR